jgi:2-dehydro-3-deoxygalactonokinase
MSPPKTPLLLCCDWGTTSFRLQLVEADTLQIRAKTTEGEGILKTFRAWTASGRPEQDRLAFYLAAIHERIASLERDAGFPLSGVPLIISGMASASVGICDIAYRKLPLAVDGSDLEVLTMPASPEFPYPLAIVSGGCTDADVMRGEETLVVGALADHTVGDEAWLVILPGTHSKHVSIRQGRAVNVATYMTGEFFALLSQQSILAQTVEAGGGLEQAGLRDEFIRGVRDGAAGNLLYDCFSIRARHLLGHASKSSNFHRLSGLLIGAELKEITTRGPAGLLLVSGPELQPFYAAAIRTLYPTRPIMSCDSNDALLRGQRAIALRVGLLQNLLEQSSAPAHSDKISSHVHS